MEEKVKMKVNEEGNNMGEGYSREWMEEETGCRSEDCERKKRGKK